MTRVEKKLKWSDEKFKRRIGTTKPVFQMMLDILQAAYYSGKKKCHTVLSISRAQIIADVESRLIYTVPRHGWDVLIFSD